LINLRSPNLSLAARHLKAKKKKRLIAEYEFRTSLPSAKELERGIGWRGDG
jgi:hypothetical protein